MEQPNELVSPEAYELEQHWERAGRPTMPGATLSHAQYRDLYQQRFRFPNAAALDQMRGPLQLLPCPTCRKQDGSIEVSRLCVTIDPHPMGAKGQIANAVCHNCGYQQMWPFNPPRVLASDHGMTATATQIKAQSANAMARMARLQQQLYGVGVEIAERPRTFEEYDQQQRNLADQIFGGPLNNKKP